MTEPAAAAPRPETTEYVKLWADSFSQVLGQMAGAPLPCVAMTQAPPDLSAAGEADLWAVCVSSGALRGEMSLHVSPEVALRFAQILMSEPPSPAEVTAEHREAAVECFRQVAGIAASAIKGRWGEVQLRLDPAPGPPSWPASATDWLRVGEEGPQALSLELQLSAALTAALRAEKPETPPPAALPPLSPAQAVAENEGKLDLLMDVELAMTMRFGGRRLLLHEILDLTPGAVIELDRQVQDPVDLLLDGRLVARGEVVVMDGNYGLRVTEVVTAAVV
jgi:flagellar motor switch protein FliN